MFNVGGGELLVILLVALVVLGPEKLPDTARKIGNVVGEIRRMSAGFQEEVRSAMDAPTTAIRDTLSGSAAPGAEGTATEPARHLEPVGDDDDIRPVDPTGRSDDPAA